MQHYAIVSNIALLQIIIHPMITTFHTGIVIIDGACSPVFFIDYVSITPLIITQYDCSFAPLICLLYLKQTDSVDKSDVLLGFYKIWNQSPASAYIHIKITLFSRFSKQQTVLF